MCLRVQVCPKNLKGKKQKDEESCKQLYAPPELSPGWACCSYECWLASGFVSNEWSTAEVMEWHFPEKV